MNKYDVLYDLHCNTSGEPSHQNLQAWINALCDGGYLANFNYPEAIVNEAYECLEHFRDLSFVVDDTLGDLHTAVDFDQLIEKLTEYEDSITAENRYKKHNRFTITGYSNRVGTANIVKSVSLTEALDELDIYQLICNLNI